MEALRVVPYIFLMLAVAGIIGGAAVLSVSKFGDQMTKCEGTGVNSESGSYNSTADQCNNSTVNLSGGTAFSPNINKTGEFVSTQQTKSGLKTVAEQFPTIGVIAVMVVIISLIAGVFAYFQFR